MLMKTFSITFQVSVDRFFWFFQVSEIIKLSMFKMGEKKIGGHHLYVARQQEKAVLKHVSETRNH